MSVRKYLKIIGIPIGVENSTVVSFVPIIATIGEVTLSQRLSPHTLPSKCLFCPLVTLQINFMSKRCTLPAHAPSNISNKMKHSPALGPKHQHPLEDNR